MTSVIYDTKRREEDGGEGKEGVSYPEWTSWKAHFNGDWPHTLRQVSWLLGVFGVYAVLGRRVTHKCHHLPLASTLAAGALAIAPTPVPVAVAVPSG